MTMIPRLDVITEMLKTGKTIETSSRSHRQLLASGGNNIPVVQVNSSSSDLAKEKLEELLDGVKKFVQEQENSRDLAFSIDEDSQNIVVTVSDTKTGELIRQIPSKELIAIAKHIERIQDHDSQDNINGLLINENA